MTSTFSQSSAGFLSNHLARLFERGLRAKISGLGIAPAQFMVLVELWEDDGLTQAALTERLAVEQATMANTLARMERDDLITRVPHPEDGRARQVRLTERAMSLRDPALTAAREVNASALSSLSKEDRDALIHLMRAAISTLQREI